LTVKRSRSASRVLAVLEGIANHQPIGVSELARLLAADKSGVQRAIMTLADAGWIATAPGTPTRWQLTPHLLTIANPGYSGNDLRQRARAALQALRNQTGETVLLDVADGRQFVVIEVLESTQLLRIAPHVGMVVPARGSATSRAMMAYMTPEQHLAVLGAPPDTELLQHFALARERGYAVSAGDVTSGFTNIAAPIFDTDGCPVGAIVVSAPSERLPESRYDEVGALVLQAARSVSRGEPVVGTAAERPRAAAGRIPA